MVAGWIHHCFQINAADIFTWMTKYVSILLFRKEKWSLQVQPATTAAISRDADASSYGLNASYALKNLLKTIQFLYGNCKYNNINCFNGN